MNCALLHMPGGAVAIVCGKFERVSQRCKCGVVAHFRCDWKLPTGRTCDGPICEAHAFEVEPDKHLCPVHQDAYRRWLCEQGIPLQ